MLEVLLDGPRARGAFLLRSVLDPPWSLRIEDEAALAVVFVSHGEAWVLTALPEVVVLRRQEWSSTLPDLLAQEATIDAPGQRAVLDRLLDVVLISALRTWFAEQAGEAPGWFRAQGDPVVGTVLGLIEASPEHPWTVPELAGWVVVSRAALGRRFTELLGQPPIAYLTQRRLQLAADLLLESDATLPAIARKVGYGSPFALSAAFKREFGLSPQEHRASLNVSRGSPPGRPPRRRRGRSRIAVPPEPAHRTRHA